MGICAHSVAAAEDNHDLQAYVRWFSNAKKAPNVVLTGFPSAVTL